MCNPISGLVVRPVPGNPLRVIFDEMDDHEALLAAHGLTRLDESQPLAAIRVGRFEYSPVKGDWEHCALKIDEQTLPTWLDDERTAELSRVCADWLAAHTISANRPAILGGTWIIRGKITVKFAARCTVHIGVGASLTITEPIRDQVVLGPLWGTLTAGDIDGALTAGDIGSGGTLTAGDIFGTPSIP